MQSKRNKWIMVSLVVFYLTVAYIVFSLGYKMGHRARMDDEKVLLPEYRRQVRDELLQEQEDARAETRKNPVAAVSQAAIQKSIELLESERESLPLKK